MRPYRTPPFYPLYHFIQVHKPFSEATCRVTISMLPGRSGPQTGFRDPSSAPFRLPHFRSSTIQTDDDAD